MLSEMSPTSDQALTGEQIQPRPSVYFSLEEQVVGHMWEVRVVFERLSDSNYPSLSDPAGRPFSVLVAPAGLTTSRVLEH